MNADSNERRTVKLPGERRGLECPVCGCAGSSVDRTTPFETFIARVRRCAHCQATWQTTERIVIASTGPVTPPPAGRNCYR